MNREEALDKANAMVAEWTGQTKNERGYVHDKWTPVDIKARTEAVLELAGFLWDVDSEPTPEEPHRHRASCDDTSGIRVCGYPDSTAPELLPAFRPHYPA